MAEQEYENLLDDENYIYVHFFTEERKVKRFVVKLLCRFDRKWYEVIRYDSGHNIPHKDILLPNGKTKRKVWYKYFNNNQALDFAIDEVKEQYEFFRWRFQQWLKHIPQR